MRFSELDGARVVVWGAGREGTAVLAALHRHAPAARIAVVADTRDGLEGVPADLETAFGDAGAALLGAAEIVVRSPGVSLYRPDVAALRAGGVRLTTATNLWMANRGDVRVVAVTGTKGKSTSSTLLHQVLAGAGIPAALGGNVGRALLDLEAPAGTTVVAELSSYQLADLEQPLDVAVVLNLFAEHQDWHGGLDAYLRDKLRAVTLSADTAAVLNAADARLRELGRERSGVTWFATPDGYHVRDEEIWCGDERVATRADVPLLGRHNLDNVCAVLATAGVLGVGVEAALPAVRGFAPLPHRLETVLRDGDGRRWVDDSISTTPESTLAALEAFAGLPVTVILGGTDRGQSYAAFAAALAVRGKPVVAVLLPDTGARIAAELARVATRGRDDEVTTIAVDTVEEAVQRAAERTPAGGVVLLSPAAASFPRYANFEDRGRRFADAARARARAGS